ncbi:uncharacterized protein [Antedon mediterranea]|uniref:uncharacterized protein n=1 Tax=Antedon mediterranea TaxID=105859 RepID=UPI003AF58A7E
MVLLKLMTLLSTLHCLYAQSDFTSSPFDVVSLIGGNATLQCSVGNFMSGDLLQWYKDGSNEYISEGLTILSNFDQRAYIEGGITAYAAGQYNIIITNLQASDTDQYRCTYDKVGTSDVPVGTTSATLTVLHQPTCSQSIASPEIGQQVNLICALDTRDVNSDVVTQVQWKYKSDIISYNAITTSTRRTLSGENNHEEFVCEIVVTEHPNVIRSCSLVPLSIDPTATVTPSGTYSITKGQTMEFQCSPIAYPHIASIDWLINARSIYDYDSIFEFELSTDRISFSVTVITDGGVSALAYMIYCRVYDPKGHTAESLTSTVIVEPFVMIPTTRPSTTTIRSPTTEEILVSFVKLPSSVVATPGSVIVLDCAVNYLNGGVMQWFNVQESVYILVGLDVTSPSDDIKNRYSIIGGIDAYNNGQYSLQITNAKEIDSGRYFCTYVYPEGRSSFSSDYADIDILSPPVINPTTTTNNVPTYVSLPPTIRPTTLLVPVTFVQMPSDIDTTAGSTIILTCTVNYLGSGEMKWFKVQDGRYIMVGLHVSISASEDVQNRYSILGGSDAYSRGQYDLQIVNVKDTDKGTYFCSHSTPGSTSISSTYATLTLLAALVCQQTPNHALPSGALVTMQCLVDDDNEQTFITWYDDLGIELTIAAANSVTYSLVLQPTDNFRSFTCSVTNAGADSFARTCSLTPLAITPVVKIIEDNAEAKGGMPVNFTCQAEAEPYVSRYEWLISGRELNALNETFEYDDIDIGVLELVPIFNGEVDTFYNITCTVYIPSGHSTTSEGVLLLVTDRGFTSMASTDDYELTVVAVVVLSLLGTIVGIVLILLCYVLLRHGRRRKLSLARKISFNHRSISGGRYGQRHPSVDVYHIDGYGSTANDAIYASPLKIRNEKKQAKINKKTANTSRESIYENSSENQRINSISSEYMNYTHDADPVQPVGFPNYGYSPESPTSLRFSIATLPIKPTVASKPETKRLSSFEPLPDVCNDSLSPAVIAAFQNVKPQGSVQIEPDELIYSNEPVITTASNNIYDDFDSDSFDSDSEDETHM